VGGRLFIDVGVARRGGKIVRKEARSDGNARCRAYADDAWRLRSTDETSRLPLHRY
jgi:hypothetical protein